MILSYFCFIPRHNLTYRTGGMAGIFLFFRLLFPETHIRVVASAFGILSIACFTLSYFTGPRRRQ
jgi:hypothetical protein